MIKIKIINTALKDEVFEISSTKPFIIGREKDCDLRIPFSVDNSISRKHCKISVIDNSIQIEDLKSSNGIYVNNIKVEKQIKIFNNDIIKVGKVEIMTETDLGHKCSQCSKFLSEGNLNITNSNKFLCIDCFSSSQTIIITKEKNSLLPKRKTENSLLPKRKTEQNLPKIVESKNLKPEILLDKTIMMPNDDFQELNNCFDLNNHIILKELGVGEVGTVFLAQNNTTTALVAIKILHTHLTGIESNRIFLLSKINRFRQLSHDNIAHFISSQQKGDRILTISEFCNQGNLVDYIISNNGHLDIEESIKITCEILEALKYAHDYKNYLKKSEELIIHGNIKPSNILFSKRSNKIIAKLSDFGMSSILDFAGVSSCTKHAPTASDLYFTSRKQITDFDCCDKSIDLWSVMACLYYMLTGKSPRNFVFGSDPYSIILQNMPMPIRQRNSEIPKNLALLIDTALDDTNNELLYSDPCELLDALKKLKL